MKDVKVKRARLKDTPMVNEFIDVFPEELPGLPPEREIKFLYRFSAWHITNINSPIYTSSNIIKELKDQV